MKHTNEKGARKERDEASQEWNDKQKIRNKIDWGNYGVMRISDTIHSRDWLNHDYDRPGLVMKKTTQTSTTTFTTNVQVFLSSNIFMNPNSIMLSALTAILMRAVRVLNHIPTFHMTRRRLVETGMWYLHSSIELHSHSRMVWRHHGPLFHSKETGDCPVCHISPLH